MRLLVTAGLVAVVASPIAARAQTSPPSVSQYVESIPTASGSSTSSPQSAGKGIASVSHTKTTHTTATQPPPRPLSPSRQKTIRKQGGKAGPALVKIATSPRLGAPQSLPRATAVQAGAIEGTGRFWLDGGARWELGLLLACIVLTTAVGALVTRRRR